MAGGQCNKQVDLKKRRKRSSGEFEVLRQEIRLIRVKRVKGVVGRGEVYDVNRYLRTLGPQIGL